MIELNDKKTNSLESGSTQSNADLGDSSRILWQNAVEKEVGQTDWRRGWDSNPRYGSPYARFRGEYFQPLSHLSAVVVDNILADTASRWLRREERD
jgi:hypothetical protein